MIDPIPGIRGLARNMEHLIKTMKGDDMEQAMTTEKEDIRSDKEPGIYTYDDGVEYLLENGKSIRIHQVEREDITGLSIEFERPLDLNHREFVLRNKPTSEIHRTSVGLTKQATAILYLLLYSMEQRGFFSVEDAGDTIPMDYDKRTDKSNA